MYSTSDWDQYRYYRDRHSDRDTRNRYDKDSYVDYHRYEREQLGRDKHYGYHQAVSHSVSQYYGNSRHSAQSESCRHSHMTPHDQRQNEYE